MCVCVCVCVCVRAHASVCVCVCVCVVCVCVCHASCCFLFTLFFALPYLIACGLVASGGNLSHVHVWMFVVTACMPNHVLLGCEMI